MLKSLYFNLFAVRQRDALIVAALALKPQTAPMLSEQLGWLVPTEALWALERKGLLTSYWGEATPQRRGMMQRFYVVRS
ncbi:hypothetical protein ACKFKG_26775 [Phormidesmis sp. 146-35]